MVCLMMAIDFQTYLPRISQGFRILASDSSMSCAPTYDSLICLQSMFFRGMSHTLVSPARSTRIFGSFPLLPSVRSWHCNAELLGSSSRLQNGSANEVWELSSVQNTGWLMNIGDHTTQYIENCNNPLEECLFINQDRKTEGF